MLACNAWIKHGWCLSTAPLKCVGMTDHPDYEALLQFLYLVPIGLIQIDINGNIVMINPTAAQLLMPVNIGGSLDNLFIVLGKAAPWLTAMTTTFMHSSGVMCDSIRINLETDRSLSGSPTTLSLSLLKLDESRIMAVLTNGTLELQRENSIVALTRDADAHTDLLTQMPNRNVVLERLQTMLDQDRSEDGRETAVFFLNCDRFKRINDTLGYAAGDNVLKAIAKRLRATLRQNDGIRNSRGEGHLAARIGSDEFVIVIDDIQRSSDIDAIARRVLKVLAEPYGTLPNQITCEFSMGVVSPPELSGSADSILQDASIAMTEAKRSGGARCTAFHPAMRIRAATRGVLEIELRRAIAQNELFVVYQPVVGLRADGSIDRYSGVEALVRWQHPAKGIIPPIEFIGIAEECGLICALGEFVLDTACDAFMGWQRTLGSRAPQSIAINLSRTQLTEPGFVDKVSRTLASTKMQASQLTLEITESIAAQGEVVLEHLHKLKTIGIKLALDDFGTGYSSLACLHLFPVDTIKIDRSFVSTADTSEHHRVLIQATILVARSLGITTVAEGIETLAQASIVKSLGCEKAQGYLYSRPLSEISLGKWLSE